MDLVTLVFPDPEPPAMPITTGFFPNSKIQNLQKRRFADQFGDILDHIHVPSSFKRCKTEGEPPPVLIDSFNHAKHKICRMLGSLFQKLTRSRLLVAPTESVYFEDAG